MPATLCRFPASLLLGLLGGLVLLALPHAGVARQEKADPPPTPAPAPFDINQPQSPKLPAPRGLEFIDQGTHDPRLKGYRTPAGVKLEVVAEDPVVVNPVGMTFAADGTPYVLEWKPSPGDEKREAAEVIKYRDGSTRTVATRKKTVKDVVKTLSDSKGKGVYDRSAVVLEDELPSSILLHDGWLYLTGRGTVRRFKQSKPGGPYDTREVIARGFSGFGQHQVSGLTLGLDGWLYVTSGDDDNIVEGSDGSRATVLRTGAVFRCRPDGSKIHTYAIGFCNPYRDVAFDVAGNVFHADNDVADAGKFTGCRLMHVPEGADFGWRLAWGEHGGRPDKVRGAAFGERPGKMPPMLKTGRGAASGLLIYNDTRLPEQFRGLLLYPDAARRLIRAYRVEPAGSTFKVVEEFELLSAPRDDLFRPCQMVTGPDGAIYIVDWRTGSGGAGKLWGDGAHGRIYRLSWAGTKEEPALPLRGVDSWARIQKLADKELIDTLSSEEGTFRDRARLELAKRGDKNRKALLELLVDDDKPDVARIAALGALQAMWDAQVQKAFVRVLDEGGVELRRLAAEGLGLNAERGDKDAHNALLKALADDEPSVRRSVAIAMGRVAGPGAPDNLASALSFDEGKDVYLRDGIVRALEGLGSPGIKALVALGDSGVQKDTDRVVEAFLGLRSREAFEALPALLKNPHISEGQRASLVRSASNYLLQPPVSVDPIVKYLAERPDEPVASKKAGLELLSTPGVVAGPEAVRWVREVAKLYLAKKLPGALRPQVAEALRRYAGKDPEAAKLLAEVKKRE